MSLPAEARVIDIGCGAGVVSRLLKVARPDLKTVGVDSADISSSRVSGIEVWSGAFMEDLPFSDASFGAAVSQFGFEYGQRKMAGRELARVLAAGAPFSFLVHHSESPILVDSGTHMMALKSLCGARLGALFLSGNAIGLDEELARLTRRFPCEVVVLEAIRGLPRHVRSSPDRRVEIWRAVTEALGPEIILEDALAKCCVTPAGRDRWVAPLRQWFNLKAVSAITLRGGVPVAWRIEGIRKRDLAA